MVQAGHAARTSTRTEAGREAIEASGAECWIGTPDRLATLCPALDGVTVLCWMLGSALGTEEELRELHTSRLEFFLTQAIDTTVRGFVYEAGGTPQQLLLEGREIARGLTERNAIPARFLTADPSDGEAWLGEAVGSVESLL
jgi:hypothetical protein